jgi:hypothetical protein
MAEDSELGGAAHLIQPAPHNVTSVAREQAMLERAVDPWDATQGADAQLALVLQGKFPSVPPEVVAETPPLEPIVEMAVEQYDAAAQKFTLVAVGNIDLRTARLKWSTSPSMMPHTFGPEKEYGRQVLPVVQLERGSVAPGKYFYQVLMNNLQVTDVREVDLV